MKNLFLVLSDIHMRENENINRLYVDNIYNVLTTLGDIDNACVIVAGDLAHSGSKNEYRKVGHLFGLITNQIKKKLGRDVLIPYYIVPGNHDINFEGKPRERIDVKELHNKGTIDKEIDDELEKFNAFYELAEKNKCFLHNKLYNYRGFETNDVNTQINLLNSELFSTFMDKSGDDDKGLHYFPESSISKIKKQKWANYTITVMHRSPEWFSWQSSQNLKNNFYKASNILICGHEHVSDIQDIEKEHKNLIMVKTGSYDFHENNFSFNTIVIDTDTNTCDIKYFVWNHEKQFYVPKTEQSNIEIKEIEVDDVLKPNINFTREFLNINNYKLDDVFVFPDIDKLSHQNKIDKTIKSIDELFDFINENNIIYIEVDSMSGKSSLAKSLYLSSIKRKKVPLFIDFDEINRKKYENVLKDAFCYQYSYDKEDYEKFKQTLKENKTVVVDNLDKIPEKLIDDFVNNLKQDFKKVILLYKPNDKCDIVELTKQRLSDTDTCERLRILPFYLRKRKELIKNVLSNSVNKVENIDGKVIEINNFISNQLQIFSINPNFITMYVSYYIDNIHNVDVQTNLFSKVFETNLVKSLLRYISSESVEEYFTIFENLAYRMHFNKKYPISIKDIQDVIKDYNSEFMMDIDFAEFRKNAINANILDEMDNDTFKFSDNSYLAYFVACAINKKANNGEMKDELMWICKNLCFNINGEILLFLSYITKNVSILNFIFASAKEIMSEWEEFDINNNDITFLKMSAEQKFELPTLEEKQEHEQNLEKQEKSLKKNLELKTKSIYDDYDETKINSKAYKVNQAMRHLELVSKILPNFNHLIKKDAKMELAKGIYEFPNKICNEVLHHIDSNFNSVIKDLLQYCEANNITKEKDNIVGLLQLEAEIFILNLFDMTARLSTNSKTIKILDSINLKNINYSILNVMMYENLGDFGEFAKRADLAYDKNKNPLIKTMIKRIVRKHFLCNKGLKQVKQVQKVADKYFGQARKYLK